MTSKHVSGVLIIALGFVLCVPREAKASSQIEDSGFFWFPSLA